MRLNEEALTGKREKMDILGEQLHVRSCPLPASLLTLATNLQVWLIRSKERFGEREYLRDQVASRAAGVHTLCMHPLLCPQRSAAHTFCPGAPWTWWSATLPTSSTRTWNSWLQRSAGTGWVEEQRSSSRIDWSAGPSIWRRQYSMGQQGGEVHFSACSLPGEGVAL